MVDSISSSSHNVNPQLDEQEKVEQHIHKKHKRHFNHFGAQHHASKKERLKKLLAEIEKMLSSQQDKDDDAPVGNNKNDVQNLIQDHVKNSVRNLREQYGINDEQLNHVHNLKDADNALAAQGDIVLSGGIAVLYLFMNLLSDLAQYKYLEMQQKAKVSRDSQDMANRVNEQIADISKKKDSDTATEPLNDDVIKYMRDNDIKVGGKSIDDYLNDRIEVPTKTWTMKQYTNDWKKVTGTIQVFKKDGQFYKWDAKAQKATKISGVSDKFGEGKLFYQPDGKKNGYWMSWGDSQQANKTQNTPMKDAFKKVGLDKGKLDAVKSALENESNRASDYVSQSQLQLQKLMQTYNVTVSLINSMQTMLEEMNKSIAQNIR